MITIFRLDGIELKRYNYPVLLYDKTQIDFEGRVYDIRESVFYMEKDTLVIELKKGYV